MRTGCVKLTARVFDNTGEAAEIRRASFKMVGDRQARIYTLRQNNTGVRDECGDLQYYERTNIYMVWSTGELIQRSWRTNQSSRTNNVGTARSGNSEGSPGIRQLHRIAVLM
jgi:hypothetical protein